jgi:hypothetical protein
MKNIIIPNKELRLLSNQLQGFNQGYSVIQIKSLDKVIQTMELSLADFNDGLKKILSIVVSQLNEKERQEGEAEKQKQLEEFLNTKGEELVTCSFEDSDLEFIKSIWTRIGTFSGSKEAREAIIKIDEALNTEPVFTK